jgi:hypothetical protein
VWVDFDQLLPLARLPALTSLSVDVNLALLPPPPGSLTPQQQLTSSASVTPTALFAREVVARIPTLLTLNGKTLLPSERAAAGALAAERVRAHKPMRVCQNVCDCIFEPVAHEIPCQTTFEVYFISMSTGVVFFSARSLLIRLRCEWLLSLQKLPALLPPKRKQGVLHRNRKQRQRRRRHCPMPRKNDRVFFSRFQSAIAAT